MGKAQKTLQKINTKPIPADIKWGDLQTMLIHLGYELIKKGKTGGSRRKFYHKTKNALISCHEPHPSPDVDKGCIADIVEHLKSQGFI